MRSRASIPSFGLALALSLPLSCCTTGLALASEGDLLPVTERLDTITSYEVSEESLMHDVQQDVYDIADLQLVEVQEVQGLRQQLTDSALTLEEHEGLRKLNTIEQTLLEIKDAVAPAESEGETEADAEAEAEGETEADGETETEGENTPTVEPATLDDVARLLMINTATLAILLGVEIWRPLYDVLSGVW